MSSLEIKGNTKIISMSLRKIPDSSESSMKYKNNNTNINSVMNLNIENNIQNLIY